MKPRRLQVRAQISLNAIIQIISLPDSESGPAIRLSEDLEILCCGNDYLYRCYKIYSKFEFMRSMFEIIDVCYRLSCHPILHFDMHGSAINGLKLSGTGEYVTWTELRDWLRTINSKTQCNLMCIFAVCHAFKMILNVEITKLTPYFILIAPRGKIRNSDLEKRMAPFYASAIQSRSVNESYNIFLMEKFEIFHAEKMMMESIAKYFRQSCMGRGKQERIEGLLSEFKTRNPPGTEIDLAVVRQFIRSRIKPAQWVIDRYRETFLQGRSCSLDIEDVLSLLR